MPWNTMPSLDICSMCQGFTTRVRTCPECGYGFCPGCFGGSGACWNCEDSWWRDEINADWDGNEDDY